jgi:hypothetical protein
MDFQDIRTFAQVGLVGSKLKLGVRMGGTRLTEMGALRGIEFNELGGL